MTQGHIPDSPNCVIMPLKEEKIIKPSTLLYCPMFISSLFSGMLCFSSTSSQSLRVPQHLQDPAAGICVITVYYILKPARNSSLTTALASKASKSSQLLHSQIDQTTEALLTIWFIKMEMSWGNCKIFNSKKQVSQSSGTTWRSGMGWRWEEGSRGRGQMYTYGWCMLMYGRNQHNIVIISQLEINKNFFKGQA